MKNQFPEVRQYETFEVGDLCEASPWLGRWLKREPNKESLGIGIVIKVGDPYSIKVYWSRSKQISNHSPLELSKIDVS